MSTNNDIIPFMDWEMPNPAETFKLFKQRLELYFAINKIKTDQQVNYILLKTGNEGLKKFNTWKLTDEEKRSPDTIFNKFLEHLEPKENFRINRLKLMSYKQKQNETIDDFVNRCRQLTLKCSLTDTEQEQRIIELIIASTPIVEFQKELLRKDNTLTLDETIRIGKTYEATNAHIKQLREMLNTNNREHNSANTDIQAIKKYKQNRKTNNCLNCGKSHERRREACPAFGSKCKTCGKYNHWATVCLYNRRSRSRSQNRDRGKQKPLNMNQTKKKQFIQTDILSRNNSQELNEQFENLTFSTINTPSQTQRDEAFAYINIKLPNRNGTHRLRIKVDTGAQGNTLPISTFRRMFPEKLTTDGCPKLKKQSKDKKLIAYNGTPIKCYGNISIPCNYQTPDWHKSTFYIVDVNGPAILGLPSLEILKMVTLHCTVKEQNIVKPINKIEDLVQIYPDQFDKIGSMPGHVRLTTSKNVQPHIDPPRKTPIALKDNIKQELEKMVSNKIIRKVTEPTDWVSSLAYSHKKDGSLRICLDPKRLNIALKRPHHATPTVEELTHHFAGAKLFSKLDAKAGYWSIHLDQESQLLTTFQSPFDRYCFQRLPFGLSVSQDIFQMKMDQILEQVDGAIGITDDIVVYSKTDKEHDKILYSLMQVAAKNGLVFNSAKCKIKSKNISFFGMLYSENGISPDPEKLKDLQNMPYPTCKKELQEFLGLVTYLSPFIPNLADKTHTLRGLL